MNTKESNAIASYINLRVMIGVLAIALPFVCIGGGLFIAKVPMQSSISIYYFTNVRDCFMGILVGVSMFLISYRGYDRWDDIVATLTGILGFGIVIFPCYSPDHMHTKVGFFQIPIEISGRIHLACALSYFFMMGYNSMFLFTKTYDHRRMTRAKKRRNLVYRVCGVLIYLSLLALILVLIFDEGPLIAEKLIMLKLETVMLLAIGVSWLIKSKTVLHKRERRKSS